jgi:hypothetical protein
MNRWCTRTSWVLRWGGLAATAVIIGLLAASFWWVIGVDFPGGSASFGFGGLSITPGQFLYTDEFLKVHAMHWQVPSWGRILWWPYAARAFGHLHIGIPLWLPLGLVSMPTSLAWWRWNRRRGPDLCPACGYDLSGIATGVCPECGRAGA